MQYTSDILEGRAIVTLKNVTSQLVSIISSIQVLPISVNESTTKLLPQTLFIDPSQGSTFLSGETLATVAVHVHSNHN